MQQFLNFIFKYRNTLLFLGLFTFAIFLTIFSNNYHKSNFINTTHFLVGSYYKQQSRFLNYFSLAQINVELLCENNELRNEIESLKSNLKINTRNSNKDSAPTFLYRPVWVINNSYHKTKNYLTIDQGIKNGVKPDMGIITDKGIIGVVQNCSENYARGLSILNTKLKINAKLKESNHFGSLEWEGITPNLMKLTDIPVLAQLKIGDTIVTGGMSTIFPEDIPIGKIKSFKKNIGQSFYSIELVLFNDMTSIKKAYVVENLHKNELIEINQLNE